MKFINALLLTLFTSFAYGQNHNIIGHYYSFMKVNTNSVTFHIAENLKHTNTLKDCQSTLKKITDSLEQIEFDTEKQNLFQVSYSSYINKDPLTAVLNTCEITVAGQGANFKMIESDTYKADNLFDNLPEQDPETIKKVMAIRSDSSKNTINLFQTKHAGLIGHKLKLHYVEVTVD